MVNLLNLDEGEKIADCRAVRDFDQPDHYLMMATRGGLVKKTELKAYSRPMKTGIIAIKLKEDDELVDVVITKAGDEVILATAAGMAIRFSEADARPMGRNTSGVKGIKLSKGDSLVGMVVADPDATLLTACTNGYGKRTPFGPNAAEGAGGFEGWGLGKSMVGRPPDPNPRPLTTTKPKASLRPASATAPKTAAARACATSRPPTATAR